jgi:hypothetical protein
MYDIRRDYVKFFMRSCLLIENFSIFREEDIFKLLLTIIKISHDVVD